MHVLIEQWVKWSAYAQMKIQLAQGSMYWPCDYRAFPAELHLSRGSPINRWYGMHPSCPSYTGLPVGRMRGRSRANINGWSSLVTNSPATASMETEILVATPLRSGPGAKFDGYDIVGVVTTRWLTVLVLTTSTEHVRSDRRRPTFRSHRWCSATSGVEDISMLQVLSSC
jgi:hypothetical protein